MTSESTDVVDAAADRSSAATEDTRHGPVPRAVGTPSAFSSSAMACSVNPL